MAKNINNWQEVKLGTICVKIGSGATPRGGSKVYIRDGVALIRSQNVYNSGFNKQGLVFIDEEHAKRLANVSIEPDDVLLNITGDSVARSCQVDNSVLPARVNQHVSIIRPNVSHLSSRFLRYFLITPGIQQYLLNLASSGATRNALTKQMIEDIALSLPRLPEQKAIAAVLSSLDDKIELLRKQNKTLEAIAQAIFKEWFVNFNFPDKNGKPYKDAGGKMIDSELGEIPEGWRVRVLAEFFPVRTGKRNANHAAESGLYPFFTCSQEPLKCNEYSFDDSAILLAGNGDFNVKWYEGKFDAYQRTYVLIPFEKNFLGFLFILMKFFLEDLTRGHRGSVISFLTKGMIEDFAFACQEDSVLKGITQPLNSLLRRIDANKSQIQTLSRLRDTLLPKLMSGQVRVKCP